MAARRRTRREADKPQSVPPPHSQSRVPAWAPPLLIGVLALGAYTNSLANGFVWDDPIILTRQLVVFRTVGDVLLPPRDIPQFSPDYYRPLTIGSYLLDRAVGGEHPFAFHLSVVIGHAVAALLVYFLAQQLLATTRAARTGALVAGALFAVHPIHTESVAWAAGRSDVLATAFLLAALLIHGRSRHSWRTTALSGLSAAAGLAAKEAAIALYPLMILRDLLVRPAARRSPAAWGWSYGGPLAAGAVYLALRRAALGTLAGPAPAASPAASHAPLDLVRAVGIYVEKLLWPVGLNAYIDHLAGGPLPLLFAGLFAVGLGLAAWRWSTASAGGVPLYALAWIGVTLAPSLAIVWKIPDVPIAERYLYLPSVGACLLAGWAAARGVSAATSPAIRAALAAAVTAVLLAALALTVRRNVVWHDDIALWTDTEAKSVVSGMAARDLGTAYQQAGRAADARAAFARALQRHNDARGLQTIYNNLGTMAMYDADYAAAQRYYQQALAANPEAADTLFNLGLAVLQAGGATRQSAQAALPYYQHALRLSPHDSDVEAAIAQVLDLLGEHADAAAHAQRALALGARGQTADGLHAILQRAAAAAASTP